MSVLCMLHFISYELFYQGTLKTDFIGRQNRRIGTTVATKQRESPRTTVSHSKSRDSFFSNAIRSVLQVTVFALEF